MKYRCFGNLQEAAVKQLFAVWNLKEVAEKQFTHFCKELLMVLNFQEAVVKPFAQNSNEILILR